MSKRLGRFAALSLVLVFTLALVAPSLAASSLTGGQTGDYTYEFTFVPNHDDGDGTDWVAVICYNARGEVYDVDLWHYAVSSSPTLFNWDMWCDPMFGNPDLLPLNIVFTDPNSPFTGSDENTNAGLVWAQSADVLYASNGVGGSDMVPIPSYAVVGKFVADAVALWGPDSTKLSSPQVVMQAGKTIWVFGIDASGQYYKVMLAGKLFWVPASSLGPNPDAVWQNYPLPTTVVE